MPPSSSLSPSPSSSFTSPSASPYRTHLKTAVPLRVSTGTSTALMRALRAILRPDLVCLFWDTMGPLYAPAPRRPTSSSTPCRSHNSSTTHPHRSRRELVAEISAQAQVPYRSGVWRGTPAAETVVRVSAQAMLGAPERAHIARLPTPAHTVRAHPETGLPPPLPNADCHLTPCYMRPPHEGERGAVPLLVP
ncbi:hypothetical protein K438DRAFT_2025875 [Mycena galopus ATCC 62051]|nr:hypothetical protein K438DRAFT_2025875 [Mycena galopus ATCC 62051]